MIWIAFALAGVGGGVQAPALSSGAEASGNAVSSVTARGVQVSAEAPPEATTTAPTADPPRSTAADPAPESPADAADAQQPTTPPAGNAGAAKSPPEQTGSSGSKPAILPAPAVGPVESDDTAATPGATDAAAPADPESPTPDQSLEAAPIVPPADGFDGLLAETESREPQPAKRPTEAPREDSGIDRDEVLRRAYSKLYRPAHNPVRPMFNARLGGGFIAGNQLDGGGTYGGIAVEAGVTWNFIGVYAGGNLAGTNVIFDSQQGRGTVVAGGAAGLNIGRLAYVRRALMNVSLGYRMSYMPLSPVYVGDPAPLIGSVVPHGPELRLDAGFLLRGAKERRLRHSVGVTIGHQVIVSVIGTDDPLFHVSTLGAFYSFG